MHTMMALVSSLALGIDVGWQPGVNGKLEYVIQIEPAALEALARGESIASDVPAELGAIECVRVVVGNQALPRIGVRQTVLRAPVESASGWQANSGPTTELPPIDAGAPFASESNRFNAPARQPPRMAQVESASPPGSWDPIAPQTSPDRVETRDPFATPSRGLSDRERIGTIFTLPEYDSTAMNDSQFDASGSGFPDDSRRDFEERPRYQRAGSGYNDAPSAGWRDDDRSGSGERESWPQDRNESSRWSEEEPRVASTTRRPATLARGDELYETSRDDRASGDSRDESKRTPTAAEQWPPLVAALIALFASLGGNMYLGWTHANLRLRYREMVGRLRQRVHADDLDRTTEHMLRRSAHRV